jgi:hypothetical protein
MTRTFRMGSKEGVAMRRLVTGVVLMALFVSLVGVMAAPRPVSAADFGEATEFKLTASDGAAGDELSFLAIDGDTLVIGASGDDVGANTNQGSAYIFVRSGNTWVQQTQLTASNGAAYDTFGMSVAIKGDTVVVGAGQHDVGANTDQGSAYVFVRSGTTWSEQAILVASDGAAGDGLGRAAISGDTVVVGANGDDASQGSAYVFVRSGTTWSEQAKLVASDGAAGDQLGNVAIDGDTAVVCAPFDDLGTNVDQGSAYVFVRSGATWSQQEKLIDSDGDGSDWFGGSVAISGETVLVGAQLKYVGSNPGQGSTFVFVRSGTTWSQQAQLTASDGAAGDQLGIMAIDGDTVVVGAYIKDVGGNYAQGSAYIFVRSGTNWSQQCKLTASDGAVQDGFGYSVAISGNTVVVDSRYDDVGANIDQGSAYIYEGSTPGGAQVAATVTLQSISVTISDGYPTAVDYGVMAPGSEAFPVTYIPATHQNIRVENNGSVAEDLLIRGSDAACTRGGTWTLSPIPGDDAYAHLYGIGLSPAAYSPLSTAASTLGSDLAVGDTVDFNLKIQTPNSSTVWGRYSTTVSVLAVSH